MKLWKSALLLKSFCSFQLQKSTEKLQSGLQIFCKFFKSFFCIFFCSLQLQNNCKPRLQKICTICKVFLQVFCKLKSAKKLQFSKLQFFCSSAVKLQMDCRNFEFSADFFLLGQPCCGARPCVGAPPTWPGILINKLIDKRLKDNLTCLIRLCGRYLFYLKSVFVVDSLLLLLTSITAEEPGGEYGGWNPPRF